MSTASSISIRANGEAFSVPADCTLQAFVEGQGLSLKRVVVELNGAPLSPSEAAAAVLREGDRLEIVRIVAGG